MNALANKKGDSSRRQPPTLGPGEARQAAPLGRMRYVLAISTVLAIVAFAAIYFLYVQ